jgi:hypothetical protein
MGLQLHIHLCCGNLHSVGFAESSCCHGGEKEDCSSNGNCCDFVEVDLSLKAEHRVPSYAPEIPVLVIASQPVFEIIVEEDYSVHSEEYQTLRGSPPSYPPIYEAIQSRIFYS